MNTVTLKLLNNNELYAADKRSVKLAREAFGLPTASWFSTPLDNVTTLRRLVESGLAVKIVADPHSEA